MFKPVITERGTRNAEVDVPTIEAEGPLFFRVGNIFEKIFQL